MKKKLKQLLALVLTLAVVMGFALPAAAADPSPRVTIEKVSNDAVTAEPEMHTAETKEDTPQYADTDMVRVSITLAGASTIDAGYATRSIANNAAADIYRTGLKVQHQAMAQRISQDVLGGEALNSALEYIVDLVSPDYHVLAGKAKDCAAGAVLLFAAASFVIGCIIFIPKLLALVFGA